jgi:hypothetical protein
MGGKECDERPIFVMQQPCSFCRINNQGRSSQKFEQPGMAAYYCLKNL